MNKKYFGNFAEYIFDEWNSHDDTDYYISKMTTIIYAISKCDINIYYTDKYEAQYEYKIQLSTQQALNLIMIYNRNPKILNDIFGEILGSKKYSVFNIDIQNLEL